MSEFHVDDRTIGAYLAEPSHGSGQGVLVLHAWERTIEFLHQRLD